MQGVRDGKRYVSLFLAVLPLGRPAHTTRSHRVRRLLPDQCWPSFVDHAAGVGVGLSQGGLLS
jgi:hypothetical protein